MDTIQVYVLDSEGMRKIGSPVPSWNDANLIVGVYPDLCRDLGRADKLGLQKFYAVRGSEMREFSATAGWLVVS